MEQAQASFFSNVPSTDILGLFSEQGRPDARKITELLDYRRQDVSVATGVPVSKVRLDNRIPREVLERVSEWGVALNLVGNFFKNQQKTVLWFKTPNPMLGNVTPRDMIRMGRFKKLMVFIQTALKENETE